MTDRIELKKRRKPDFSGNGKDYYFSAVCGFPCSDHYAVYFEIKDHRTDEDIDFVETEELDYIDVSDLFYSAYNVVIDPYNLSMEFVEYIKPIKYFLSDDEVKENLLKRRRRLVKRLKNATDSERRKLKNDIEIVSYAYAKRFIWNIEGELTVDDLI